jgi:hypothetical protein
LPQAEAGRVSVAVPSAHADIHAGTGGDIHAGTNADNNVRGI